MNVSLFYSESTKQHTSALIAGADHARLVRSIRATTRRERHAAKSAKASGEAQTTLRAS
jgi:hypothetical protein